MPHIARRMADIEAFHVMDILARARELEARGRDIIHMEIGEPDFPAPAEVVEAGLAALREGKTQYLPALGLPALREALSASYAAGYRPDARRVIVTPGSSGALVLVFGVLLDPGDEVLMSDPGYPCNRHFARFYDGQARLVPVGTESSFQLTADLVDRHWTPRTRAVLVSSPSNPVGTMVPDDEMRSLASVVRDRGGVLIVDEIYHGLTYGQDATSALAYGNDIFVVNSFSKYFGMTGWRIGWTVAPADYVDAIDRLAQNIFLASGTVAQYAALAALSPAVRPELERRRDEFRARRDYLVPALQRLGFDVPVVPDGAFYIYAGCNRVANDSETFARELLDSAGVAITPGRDFGVCEPERHVRFSYANTLSRLKEGVSRIEKFLDGRRPLAR